MQAFTCTVSCPPPLLPSCPRPSWMRTSPVAEPWPLAQHRGGELGVTSHGGSHPRGWPLGEALVRGTVPRACLFLRPEAICVRRLRCWTRHRRGCRGCRGGYTPRPPGLTAVCWALTPSKMAFSPQMASSQVPPFPRTLRPVQWRPHRYAGVSLSFPHPPPASAPCWTPFPAPSVSPGGTGCHGALLIPKGTTSSTRPPSKDLIATLEQSVFLRRRTRGATCRMA